MLESSYVKCDSCYQTIKRRPFCNYLDIFDVRSLWRATRTSFIWAIWCNSCIIFCEIIKAKLKYKDKIQNKENLINKLIIQLLIQKEKVNNQLIALTIKEMKVMTVDRYKYQLEVRTPHAKEKVKLPTTANPRDTHLAH